MKNEEGAVSLIRTRALTHLFQMCQGSYDENDLSETGQAKLVAAMKSVYALILAVLQHHSANMVSLKHGVDVMFQSIQGDGGDHGLKIFRLPGTS